MNLLLAVPLAVIGIVALIFTVMQARKIHRMQKGFDIGGGIGGTEVLNGGGTIHGSQGIVLLAPAPRSSGHCGCNIVHCRVAATLHGIQLRTEFTWPRRYLHETIRYGASRARSCALDAHRPRCLFHRSLLRCEEGCESRCERSVGRARSDGPGKRFACRRVAQQGFPAAQALRRKARFRS